MKHTPELPLLHGPDPVETAMDFFFQKTPDETLQAMTPPDLNEDFHYTHTPESPLLTRREKAALATGGKLDVHAITKDRTAETLPDVENTDNILFSTIRLS